jgi:hypothetical protein
MKSKWQKGVELYADELREFLEEHKLEATEENVLNGARDWSEYSFGGSSLIYDYEIAERLATPSEVKRCTRKDGSLRRPNAREEWLDVQARALYQACMQVLRGVK